MFDLTSLMDSTVTFTTGFSVEIFMSSRQTWVKICVGIALAMMLLPVTWFVWVTIEAGTGFSVSNGVRLWKDRVLNGASEPVPGAGDVGGKSGKPPRFRTLKEAFNFIPRPSRGRASASSKLNLTGSGGSCSLSDKPGAGGEVDNKEQGSAV